MVRVRVMKFGGSILSTPKFVGRVIEIILKEEKGPIVILSAMNGITDKLESILAQNDLEVIDGLFRDIETFHLDLMDRLIKNGNIHLEAEDEINHIIEWSRREFLEKRENGISDKFRDRFMVLGERISVMLMSAVLEDRGCDPVAISSEDLGLISFGCPGNGSVAIEEARSQVRKKLKGVLKEGKIPLITGYYGTSYSGDIICFGRNGSDYSSAVIASIMKVKELEIWKDVPGFMSADPRLIKDARRIDHLTYDEAAELSYYGALIIHPKTVEPLRESGIPLVIRNIHDKKDSTNVRNDTPAKKGEMRSITFSRKIGILKIWGDDIGNRIYAIKKMMEAIEHSHIKIRSMNTTMRSLTLVLERKDLERCQQLISGTGLECIDKIEPISDLSLVGIVGEGISERAEMTSKVLKTLVTNNIDIEMIMAGPSEVSYFFIVKEEDLSSAVNAVHDDHILRVVEDIQMKHQQRLSRYAG